MDKKHWQKIKSLFESVSGLPLEEREKFLDENCGEDIELRKEVEKLLNSSEEADTSFLEEAGEKEVVSQILEQETRAICRYLTIARVDYRDYSLGDGLHARHPLRGLKSKIA